MKKKMKKPTKKRMIIGGCLVAGIVVVAGVGTKLSKSMVANGAETSNILSVEVTTKTIETGVSGTGTLAYGDSVKITVPSDLEIDELNVSAGTSVTAGTLLATVDEASLATCLSEVQEAISDVDSTIASEKSSTQSESVTAGVSGRVKVIYAEEGDKVIDVMKEKGALMILSTDGYMAVDLENAKSLEAGNEVTVTDGDTEISATVDCVKNETAVILFADSSFENEEELTVKDADGNSLGKANAYINEPLKVVGTNGTIDSVNVSVGSTVYASTKVFTLEETCKTAEYLQAVKEREQLIDLLAVLIDIQSNGGIVAETDGVVENINVNSTTGTTESSSSSSMTLGDTEEKQSVTAMDENEAEKEDVTAFVAEDKTEEKSVTVTKAIGNETSGVTLMSSLGTAQADVGDSQTAGNSDEATANKDNTDGSNTTDTSSTEASKDSEQTDSDDKSNASSEEKEDSSSDKNSTENPGNSSEKTTEAGNQSSTKEESSSNSSGNQNSNMPSGGSSAKSTGSSGGSSTAGTSTSSTTTSSAIDTVNAFEISGGNTMKVAMAVDELDILSMKEGLEAQVSIDAIEGETFTGEITSVSGSASSSGETAQYSVEITFEKTDQMLAGMSASVEVILEKAENVLVVPLAAVTDHGRTSVVYTGKNDKDGTLTDEVEVELGVSDETYVEIKSGLSQGDTIYYQMQGSEDSSNSGSMNGFGNFDKGMPNGNFNGEKPQRPDMQGGNGALSGGSRGGQQ